MQSSRGCIFLGHRPDERLDREFFTDDLNVIGLALHQVAAVITRKSYNSSLMNDCTSRWKSQHSTGRVSSSMDSLGMSPASPPNGQLVEGLVARRSFR